MPRAGDAGFHHCALTYDCELSGPERFAPYVANGDGRLLDAFQRLAEAAAS